MKLKDAIRWMNLNTKATRNFLADHRKVVPSKITPEEEISFRETCLIGKEFPNHTRVLVIKYIPQNDNTSENMEAIMLGDWTGRLMRAATRVFSKSYKIYRNALLLGRDEVSFRTYPSHEEITALREESRLKSIENEELLAKQLAKAEKPPKKKKKAASPISDEPISFSNDIQAIAPAELEAGTSNYIETIESDLSGEPENARTQ